MEQFEKWLCKNYGKLMDGTSFEYNTKESWKAALKWVLSIDSGFCSCGCPNDSWDNPSVLAQIEKELEE